jgi:hypothetical protein
MTPLPEITCYLGLQDPYLDLMTLTGPLTGILYINKSPYVEKIISLHMANKDDGGRCHGFSRF